MSSDGDKSSPPAVEGEDSSSLQVNEDVADSPGDNKLEEGDEEPKSEVTGPRYTYNKDQLIAISKCRLARLRPSILEEAFNNQNGLWDPQKWVQHKCPMVSSVPNSSKANYGRREASESGLKKVNDGIERIIEENKDNIILSPQRRSFGTGCHVTANKNNENRKAAAKDEAKEEFGDDLMSSRSNFRNNRVGTGRIIPRNEWGERGSYEKPFRDERFDHNEARSNNSRRMSNESNSRSSGGFRHNRYDRKEFSKYSSREEEEDEPEWFTGGPSSKHETIELKGFDDEFKEVETLKDKKKEQNVHNQSEKSSSQSLEKVDDDDFDVNALMLDLDKFDPWIDNLDKVQDFGLSNSQTEVKSQKESMSRFKQWFKENPDQNRQVANSEELTANLKSANETLKSASTLPNKTNKQENIIDILQKANINVNHLMNQQPILNNFDPSKAKSVSELEANLSSGLEANRDFEDKVAFDKLFNNLEKNSIDLLTGQKELSQSKFNSGFVRNSDTQNSKSDILKNENPTENVHRMAFEQNLAMRNNFQQQEVFQKIQGTPPRQFSMETNPNLARLLPPSMTSQNSQLLQNMLKLAREEPQQRYNLSSPIGHLLEQASKPIVRQKTATSTFNSFTPTSVIRKMHSEKEKEGSTRLSTGYSSEFFSSSQMKEPKPIEPENKSLPHGPRPIVKSNEFNTDASRHSPTYRGSEFAQSQVPDATAFLQRIQQQAPASSTTTANLLAQRQANISPTHLLAQHSSRPVLGSTPNNNQNLSFRNVINPSINNQNIRVTQLQQLVALQQQQQQQQQQRQQLLQQRQHDIRQAQLFAQSKGLTLQQLMQLMKSGAANTGHPQPMPSGTSFFSPQEVQQANARKIQGLPNDFNQQEASYSFSSNQQSPRNLTQLFGNEMLNQNLREMPAIPVQEAFTLDDIEQQ